MYALNHVITSFGSFEELTSYLLSIWSILAVYIVSRSSLLQAAVSVSTPVQFLTNACRPLKYVSLYVGFSHHELDLFAPC